MKKKIAVFAVLVLTASNMAFANPSFDCAKASSQVEKMICANETLQKLDSALSSNYHDMMAVSDDLPGGAKDLKQEQKAWIIKRNKCTSEKCLTDLYRSRVDEVCNIPMIKGLPPVCIESENIK